jgi:hypothetical protein
VLGEKVMPNDTRPFMDAIVFSMAEGVVWASWPGKTQRVELGPYDGVTYMMRTFLATCEIGERMTEKGPGKDQRP